MLEGINAVLNTTKTKLHELVDALPESEVHTAGRFLEFLIGTARDPLMQALLNAPEDDEPVTEADSKAIEEAEQDIGEGRTKSLDDVMREFGL